MQVIFTIGDKFEKNDRVIFGDFCRATKAIGLKLLFEAADLGSGHLIWCGVGSNGLKLSLHCAGKPGADEAIVIKKHLKKNGMQIVVTHFDHIVIQGD